ncbi:MAG: hypothetical protein M0Z63_10165 [Actinomycetota bacterium]|nr:hypothetical protein [Actinomycetota bacterium]MDA8280765.1 hypothetical protein [Actinomycetota bacterium]
MRMRARRLLLTAGSLVALAAVLSSCSSSAALALARRSCVHVERSINLYERSLHAPTPALAAAGYQAAVAQLELAQPDAATAAGQDGQWQALMTTISESPRVPLGLLVHALGAQCAVAQSPGGNGL